MGRPRSIRAAANIGIVATSCVTSTRPRSTAHCKTSGSSAPSSPTSCTRTTSTCGAFRSKPRRMTLLKFSSARNATTIRGPDVEPAIARAASDLGTAARYRAAARLPQHAVHRDSDPGRDDAAGSTPQSREYPPTTHSHTAQRSPRRRSPRDTPRPRCPGDTSPTDSHSAGRVDHQGHRFRDDRNAHDPSMITECASHRLHRQPRRRSTVRSPPPPSARICSHAAIRHGASGGCTLETVDGLLESHHLSCTEVLLHVTQVVIHCPAERGAPIGSGVGRPVVSRRREWSPTSTAWSAPRSRSTSSAAGNKSSPHRCSRWRRIPRSGPKSGRSNGSLPRPKVTVCDPSW